MASFYPGCKNTAYCVFMTLSLQGQVQARARRDDMTEQEIIQAALVAYFIANP